MRTTASCRTVTSRGASFLGAALREQEFCFAQPDGAYFFFADFTALKATSTTASPLPVWMTEKVQDHATSSPSSSFYRPGAADGKRHYVRFAFCQEGRDALAAAV